MYAEPGPSIDYVGVAFSSDDEMVREVKKNMESLV